MSEIRRMDDLGRVSISKETRKKYHLNEGSIVHIEPVEKGILIRPADPITDILSELKTKLYDLIGSSDKEKEFWLHNKDTIHDAFEILRLRIENYRAELDAK